MTWELVAFSDSGQGDKYFIILFFSLAKGLVTYYGEGGGLQNGKGGHVKFYPYEKGGRKKF